MPVSNIVDKRSNEYDTVANVIYENRWNDDVILCSIQFTEDDNISGKDCEYFGVETASVRDAIEYANYRWTGDVTLHLYDVGSKNQSDAISLKRDEASGLLEPFGEPCNDTLCEHAICTLRVAQ